MTTVLYIRHGRTEANAQGVLAGWTPGLGLDDVGREQARALGRRLAGVPLLGVVSSPLDRSIQTAEVVLAESGLDVPLRVDERIGEVHYGDWTGRRLKDLAKEPLWSVVQAHPSAAVFPGVEGEPLAAVQHRAVAAVREWNTRLGDRGIYAVVSHGDVIKAALADALGMHLDQFQRIVVDPCSVSIVTYGRQRPFVVRTNDSGGDLSWLAPEPRHEKRKGRRGDADVGGGAGR